MSLLSLSEHLKIPLDVLSQKLAVIGRSGSGKSYLAMKLAELLLDAHGQVIVIDPVGVWHGLRLSANGKDPGIAIPILGGQRGDIPLEPSAGSMIADVLVDRATSMILDVSEMTGGEQRRFIADFATRFLHRKKQHRSPVMLIWEESQEFVPQRVFPDAAKMVGAMERLIKIGRNFGIGTTLITQRPQAVNKDVLNQTEVLIVYQTTGPHERKAIEGWIVEHGLDMKNFVDELPHLPQGTGWLWSPQWLRKLEKIRALPRRTYDASATPVFSTKHQAIHDLAPIDLEQIQEAMASTIEKAKQDDPRVLRAEITKLKAELQKTHIVATPKVDIQIKEVPVLKGKQLAQLETFCTKLIREAERHGSATSLFWSNLNQVADSLLKAIKATTQERPLARGITRTAAIQRPYVATKMLSVKASREREDERGLAIVERKFLTALAQQDRRLTRNQIAIFAGYSAKSRHVDNTLAALRSHQYVVGGREGIEITDVGRTALGPYDPLPTGEGLRQYWLNELDRAASAFLLVICGVYPQSLTRDELAEQAGYSPQSRHVDNTLAQLRSRDLVTGGRQAIRASEELFG